jgi:hypothetical protein
MKMAVFWVVAPCSVVEFTDVSDLLAGTIFSLLMDAGSTSYQTARRYNPEDGHLHRR